MLEMLQMLQVLPALSASFSFFVLATPEHFDAFKLCLEIMQFKQTINCLLVEGNGFNEI